ncbi:probable ATP-dependent RNA helicase DHX37 [Mya arenaria]|uniref:probable ATP-dependent RNA helicase DHX37 n=1 Tax=Mya arenaria TaxID=6604 RepID=UPI0022E9874A|nr:probable ATP-dependent RNA helicase DHX37 [Mya arenaria]XP_052800894.1 probable ATP-dependent RNA helicase DHX37 [Mya arenaria]
MGKKKLGFNWKARIQNETVVDKSSQEEIHVEIDLQKEKGYDDSNALVLPSKKRDSAHKHVQEKKIKRLTKKERKKLEKVIETKEKKAKRADIFVSLAAHQASQDEMRQLISISEVQSGKVKRKHDDTVDKDVTVNSIAGSNRKRRRKQQEIETEKSDDEESIHTSDMSTDEEDSGVVSEEEIEKPVSVEVQQKEAETAVCKIEDCREEVVPVNLQDNVVESVKLQEETVNENDKRVKQRTCSNPSKTRKHVRSTSSNWVVSDITKKEYDSQKVDSDVKTNQTVSNLSSEDVSSESSKKSSNSSKIDQQKKEVKEPAKRVVNIPVYRDETIQTGRLKLPILGEEQVIMEAISEHPVVIICGETGSGKTTQVPQFLYEAGYAHGGGIIGVTEPRRVAAVSMSNRVAMEMSLSKREVSYQIRYEGNVTDNTKIKFMTDGVLLKEVQKDFLLTKYSAIIIDEAHERSVYTDILIGLLSRIVPLRTKRGNPLKLIIMSATLRVEDFTENKRLFRVTPPVIKVDARQFPVTVHYNKRTPLEDYLGETFRKTCKIHRMLPEGGILVFVTGQQEVHTLCRKLKAAFPMYDSTGQPLSDNQSSGRRKHTKKETQEEARKLPNISLDSYSVSAIDDEEQQDQVMDDLDDTDDRGIHDNTDDVSYQDNTDDLDPDDPGHTEGSSQPVYVLPLYSLLPTDKQAKVFGPVPDGCRLCVVATNVAETSLTIPGIKYVVDTGKMKTKFYDKVTGVSTFRVTWTSKASADQRAGRAGRVGPGHCYRLYSSAVLNDEFEKFSPAEITRRPVDDLVLQMKDMNIEKIVNFPYPTQPDMEQIRAAENLLISLGALTQPQQPKSFKDSKKEATTTITPLGRAMACFPVSPRYAKMLSLGHQHGLLPYVVAIVAALSVQELFVEVYSNPDVDNEVFKDRLLHLTNVKRRWAAVGDSLLLGDLMVLLKAVGSCEFEGCTPAFCDKYGIRIKAMREVRKLRVQLTNSVNLAIPDADVCVDPKMSPPDEMQARLLRQIVLAGMGDHVARKMIALPSTSPDAKKLKNAYQVPDLEEPVFIHPTSVLYKQRPEWLVFQHMEETSKLYMKGLTAIEPEWLPVFCPSHVTLSKPLEDPPPRYNPHKGQVLCTMTGTFGNRAWSLPAVEMEYPMGLEKMRWFARALLVGEVVSGLGKYTPHLLSQPATMVKSWAKLQPRTESLLKCLVAERVDSKDTLLAVWNKQPTYLFSAIKEWLPESLHTELSLKWPPLVT